MTLLTSSDDCLIGKEASEIIEAIIKRGNDAEVRRKGDGYIILEVEKTIRYRA